MKPQPLRVFSVNLSSAITNVTVSPEFIQGNADYAFEVLAIEASGNQTISEGAFKTQEHTDALAITEPLNHCHDCDGGSATLSFYPTNDPASQVTALQHHYNPCDPKVAQVIVDNLSVLASVLQEISTNGICFLHSQSL